MADQNIRIQIEAVLRDMGLKQATQKLQDLDKAAGKTSGSVFNLSEAFGGLGRVLAGGAILEFTRRAVVEFSKLDRALSVLKDRLDALDRSEAFDGIVSSLLAIERAGGASFEQSIPALNRFLSLLGNVDDALRATALASDIAEKKQIDLSEAAQLLAMVLNGQGSRAARTLDIAIRDLNGNLKTNDELLRDIIREYSGFTDATDDSADAVDKLGSAWDRFKRGIGDLLSPLTIAVSKLYELADAAVLASIPWNKPEIRQAASRRLREMTSGIPGFDLFGDVPTKELPGMSAAWAGLIAQSAKAGLEMSADELEDLMESEGKIAADALKKGLDAQKKAVDEAWANFYEVGSIYRLDEKARREAGRTTARDFAGLIPEFDPSVVDAATGKELDYIRDLTTQFLQEQLDAATENVTEQFRLRQEILTREWQRERAMWAEGSEAQKLVDKRYTVAFGALAAERTRITKLEAEARIAANLAAAQSALGALSQAFPEIKAFAIAQAILNAYEAATKSMAATGGFFPAAAAVFSAVMQIVSQMRAVTPSAGGLGGGLGSNRGGGRIIAGDAAAGAAAQRPPGQQSSMVVNIHGTVIDSQQATRKLHRALKVEERRDRARFAR